MNFKNQIAKLLSIDVLKCFYLLYSLSLISRIVCDYYLNRIGIHSGEIYPNRKLNFETPPYSLTLLYFEWCLMLFGAILINTKFKRIASGVLIISLCMSISQMFQNQKTLMLIVACAVFVMPLDLKNFKSIWFLKFQILLLYLFSAVHKMNKLFLSGKVLESVFLYLREAENNYLLKKIWDISLLPTSLISLAWITVFIELSLPLLLLKRPKSGIFLVIFFHVSLNLSMIDIMPFTLCTIALSFLFLLRPNNRRIQ